MERAIKTCGYWGFWLHKVLSVSRRSMFGTFESFWMQICGFIEISVVMRRLKFIGLLILI